MTMTTEHTTTQAGTAETLRTVTVQASDLHNAVKNIVLFTSKDDTLPVLTAARLVIRNGNLIMEATDRYRLGQINVVHPGNEEVSEYNGEPLRKAGSEELGLIGKDDLKRLEQLLREPAKSKMRPRVTMTFSDGQINFHIEAIGTDTGMTFDVWQIIGDYPKIDRLFDDAVPESDVGAMVSAFNGRYLQDIARLRDWREGPSNQTIRVGMYQGNKPTTFHAVNSDGLVWCQAMLMPIRIPANVDVGNTLGSPMARKF